MYKRSSNARTDASHFASKTSLRFALYKNNMDRFQDFLVELFTRLSQPFNYPKTHEEISHFSDVLGGTCVTDDRKSRSEEIDRVSAGRVALMRGDDGSIKETFGGEFTDCSRFVSLFHWKLVQEFLGSDFVDSMKGFPEGSKLPINFRWPIFKSYGEWSSEEDIKKGTVLYLNGVEEYKTYDLDGFGRGCWVICVGKRDDGEWLFKDFSMKGAQDGLTREQWQQHFIHEFRRAAKETTLEDPFTDNDIEYCINKYRISISSGSMCTPEVYVKRLETMWETGALVQPPKERMEKIATLVNYALSKSRACRKLPREIRRNQR